MILIVKNLFPKWKWIIFIVFRDSHWHWHMWVYSTRLFWGLEHPPNLNWKEWTVLLSDLTFACIRVKPETSVITLVLLSFIPVTPINPEKRSPDFISLLYHQGNHIVSSQHLYTANSLEAKMPLRVQAGRRYQGLFCLVEPVWPGISAQADGWHWDS